MKVEGRFPLQIAIAFGGITLAGIVPLIRLGSPDMIKAAIAGALLSTANVLLGYLAIQYGFDKSYTTFVKAILGGMALRMAGMLGMLVLLILGFGFHAMALTVSMLGFYLVYLVLEILFIQQKVTIKDRGLQ